MKKYILLIFVILATSLNGYAQMPTAKYQGDVQLGYSLGIGTYSANRVNLHMINSIRIGEHFSTGLGVGLDYYHEGVETDELALPLYLNLKGYYPVSPQAELFLSTDIGVSIGLTEGLSGYSGFLFTPSVGTRVKIYNDKAILFSLGYHMQKWSESGFSINTDAIQFKVGFSF